MSSLTTLCPYFHTILPHFCNPILHFCVFLAILFYVKSQNEDFGDIMIVYAHITMLQTGKFYANRWVVGGGFFFDNRNFAPFTSFSLPSATNKESNDQ